MKKLIFLLITFLFLLPIASFATGGENAEPFDFEQWFLTLSAMVTLTITVTEFIKKWIGAYDNWARAVSWVVGIGIVYLGWWLDLGLLYGLTWYQAGIYGLGVSLAANGVFTIPVVQNILEFILNLFPKTK